MGLNADRVLMLQIATSKNVITDSSALAGPAFPHPLQLSLLSSFHALIYHAPLRIPVEFQELEVTICDPHSGPYRTSLFLITRGATLKQSPLIPVETIEKTIYLIRGQKVMLDADLALLYQVTTKALNQAMRRNRDRFPDDFMFQLTTKELEELNRSQIVTASQKHRDPRFRPYAFTEQGVAMLSSVVSQQAGSTRQHRDHARLCKVAPNARLECRPLATAG